jgi:16S rRNA (cytidine1402-2'-O)-methyltransferase
VVLYESPHRVAATLEALASVFGAAEVVLGRELTKQFEEFRRGTAAELAARLRQEGARGEITLVVNPAVSGETPDGE